MEVEHHECLEENDQLRSQLGLKRRHEKNAKDTKERIQQESDRALNIILQREIDKLEQERVDMKMQVRMLRE